MFNDKNNSEVKDRILKVSRELFIRNGYNNTSVRDIASASGTNIAMVNYYFNSKYNLFEIIFDDALTVLFDRILKVLQSDKSFFDLLASWIDSYYETFMEYPQIPDFILNAISQNPERLTERIRKFDPYSIFMIISARLQREVENGTIQETPPLDFLLNVLSLCVFPFIFGPMATKVAGRTPEDYREVLENHKKYVINFVTNAIKTS